MHSIPYESVWGQPFRIHEFSGSERYLEITILLNEKTQSIWI